MSAPGYLVVDASISLKWALNDEESIPEADALLNDAVIGRAQLLAPSLWVYEVTNGLVVARRRGRIDRAQSARALGLLLSVGVRIADPEPRECMRLANDFDTSGYDAAYLALAEAVDGSFWTGDPKLFERVKGGTTVVHWIGDYPPAGD